MSRDQGRFKIVREFGGEFLKLILRKKKVYKDKIFDLYTVCKIKNGETIPLYDTALTPSQVDAFYNNPTYYLAGMREQEGFECQI